MGHSTWNFQNKVSCFILYHFVHQFQPAQILLIHFNSTYQKVHLLEAECFSQEGRHDEAKASYAAAITSARCSRFVHEQGLACEMAGFHYKKMGDDRSAWGFFHQAKECYETWGSQVKVAKMSRQLESFEISAKEVPAYLKR